MPEFYARLLALARMTSGGLAQMNVLDAAAKGGRNNPLITGIAAFYQAMSLFRQGKKEEAHRLAASAAAKMKLLPKDDNNPLAGGASLEDLFTWLAYKEARTLLKIDLPTYWFLYEGTPGGKLDAERDFDVHMARLIRSIDRIAKKTATDSPGDSNC